MHNLLCRLCLRVTTEDQWKLFDKYNFIENIRPCLNLELTNEVLPRRLCNICFMKIEEINEFCLLVKKNQQTLLYHLQNSSLTEYYTSLTTVIKKEFNLKKYEDKIKEDENNGAICEVLNATEFEEENKTKTQNELIKDKGIIKNDFYDSYSSDNEDNVSLSIIKQEKKYSSEVNHKNIIEKSFKNVLEQYNCLSCDNVYETHNSLREHYKNAHTKEVTGAIETSFTEQICNGNVMFKCDKCKKVYTKKNMKRHIMYHSNERPYVCKLCARTYKTVSDIMRHGFRAHSGHKLHCTYKCGFCTAYTGALKEHEDRVHKNKYKYTCEECGKGFQVKTWYEQHQNVHSGLKPFVCDICGLAFHMDKYLKTHYSTMHPQSLDKKRLVCLQCDTKCDSVNSLSIHLQNEHDIPRFKTKCKRTCLCDYCGKVLNRPEQLHTHRKMHLGEKPYHCSICNKSFLRKFSLRVHERAHSRTRDHACEPCGTRYSQPSALYRHQRIHHGLPRKQA